MDKIALLISAFITLAAAMLSVIGCRKQPILFPAQTTPAPDIQVRADKSNIEYFGRWDHTDPLNPLRGW